MTGSAPLDTSTPPSKQKSKSSCVLQVSGHGLLDVDQGRLDVLVSC